MTRFPKYRLMMTEEPTGGGGGMAGGTPQGGAGGLGGSDPAGQGGLGGGAVNPWDSVPKSWAAEHHSHWTGVTPEVRRIIHQRETDVEKGIRTYADGHGRWTKLHGVFGELHQQNPQLDTSQLYEALGQNHMALLKGTPEQRRQMLADLAKYYGVDFAQAAAGQQGAQAAAGLDESKVTELVNARVKEALTPIQQERQREAQARMTATVDAFFSDPKNKYAKDVSPLMVEIIKSGIRDLPMAYEMAILRSPEVKAKYLADLAQGGAGGQGEGEPSGDRNLNSSGQGAPAGKPKTIDDTMAAIARKHYGGKK